jgi:hypothetical protein
VIFSGRENGRECPSLLSGPGSTVPIRRRQEDHMPDEKEQQKQEMQKDLDKKIFDYADYLQDAAGQVTTNYLEQRGPAPMVAVRASDGFGSVKSIVLTGQKASAFAEFARQCGRFANVIGAAMHMYEFADDLAKPDVYNGVRSLATRTTNFQQQRQLDALDQEQRQAYAPPKTLP